MKIAILSDTHDNIWKLTEILRIAQERGAQALICCGDLCSPFTLRQIGEEFAGPVHVVLGNNDGDPLTLSQVATASGHITLHGLFGYIELGGRKIAINHYPPIALDQAYSGRYDLVCYGHDHKAHIGSVGHTLLVNPGEAMGKSSPGTLALYDTETAQAELIQA